ncbi:hypothetical protein [Paenibacillus brasilensis]|uniref:Uncharacterized protein n=1 Tax=Paenibacillus brasilensis TaxID=128574 RepID=A0ABU0L7J5_9BACL|nr:hypothetical protein [Paenibacillus brasilensis]MDQ0497260.1 hypothetical protein [Paenibacillus brasilensis]
MKKKHLIASALSLGLLGGAIAVPSAIFADADAVTESANTSTTATQDAGTTTTGDHVITPQKIGNTFGSRVQGGATVQGAFEVPKGYGHVKLTLKNYSSYPVKVSVTHNDSGKEYISGTTISPNSTLTWRSTDKGITDGLRSGSYTIQFRGGNYDVNAEFNGVAGSQPSDL